MESWRFSANGGDSHVWQNWSATIDSSLVPFLVWHPWLFQQSSLFNKLSSRSTYISTAEQWQKPECSTTCTYNFNESYTVYIFLILLILLFFYSIFILWVYINIIVIIYIGTYNHDQTSHLFTKTISFLELPTPFTFFLKSLFEADPSKALASIRSCFGGFWIGNCISKMFQTGI